MRRRNKILALVLVLAAAGILVAELAELPGIAEEPGPPVLPAEARTVNVEEPASGGVESPVAPAPVPTSAMMQEINQVLAAEQATVASLQSQIQSVADHEQALAIQKEAERAKQETELIILGLQAEHARLEGRTEQAAEIEQAVEEIINPPVRPAPGPQRDPADGIGR